jgi:hypothetical protein
MTRWIATAIFACVLSLAFATPFATETKADGMRASYSHKRCVAPASRWRPQTAWVCKVSEKCCYDWLLRRGSCAADRCF